MVKDGSNTLVLQLAGRRFLFNLTSINLFCELIELETVAEEKITIPLKTEDNISRKLKLQKQSINLSIW